MNDPKKAAIGSYSTEKRTLVEDGTHFKGSLTSSCPIVVQGSVEGTLEAPSVTVSSTGSVSGMATASVLKSSGRIAGEFDVETAHVSGTVAKDTIISANSLDLQVSTDKGKLELTFGEQRSDRRS